MSMYPPGTGGSSSSENNMIDEMPVNEVFVKNSSGDLVPTGIRLLSNGTVLAPENFGVESGSVNFGDLITLSEASGLLGLWNHVDMKQYYMVDYYVPRDKPSDNPTFFRLTEAENKFNATPDTSVTLTANPLTFTYTTKLNARTNAIILYAAKAMTNLRFKISIAENGVGLKYIPGKAAWETGTGGINLKPGANTIDYKDSPLPLEAGTLLHFEFRADNMALLGNTDGIAAITSWVQRGEYVSMPSVEDITREALFETLMLSEISNAVLNSSSDEELRTLLKLGDSAVLNTNVPGGVPTLNDEGKLIISYKDLTEKPTLFTGAYSDLTGKPTLFSGAYADLTGKPTIPDAQVNADWTATTGPAMILNKPALFSGAYADLTGKPTIPAAQVQSDWNATTGMGVILNKPVIPVTEVIQGTTNASGVLNVVFTKKYTSVPHVNPAFINNTAGWMMTVTNLTTTGCTLTVVTRNAVTLLGLEVLLAATGPVNGAQLSVLVVSRD